MKILVTVKEVTEVPDNFEIEGTSIVDQNLEYDLNEWDDYAIEEAVQLHESEGDIEIVSATIGPERAEETIRIALAKGVDRAIRVWDDALADKDFLDVATKTAILGAVVAEEEPDLIFSGVQAKDDSFGATGVSLASAIGFQWAAVVTDTTFEFEEGVAHIRRELEGGVEELVDVDLPAVLTIQTGINEPRYASLRGIRQAQSKEIAQKTLNDIGLDRSITASPIVLTDMYEPETESETRYFEGSTDEKAADLAQLLQDQGVGTT